MSDEEQPTQPSNLTDSLPRERFAAIERLAKKEEERLEIDIEDRRFAAARRHTVAAQEDARHAAQMRQATKADEYNATLAERLAIERAERLARTEDCASATDYRTRLVALLPAQEDRGERWIACVERMAKADERNAAAQERIASALEALAGKP